MTGEGVRDVVDATRPAATAPILLYDGECRLCLRTVAFVRARSRKGAVLRFVPAASEEGQAVAAAVGRADRPLHSVLYVEGGKVWERSAAILRLARWMRWPWSWLRAAAIVPRPARDAVYDLVARNRYRFGRKRDGVACACEDDGER